MTPTCKLTKYQGPYQLCGELNDETFDYALDILLLAAKGIHSRGAKVPGGDPERSGLEQLFKTLFTEPSGHFGGVETGPNALEREMEAQRFY